MRYEFKAACQALPTVLDSRLLAHGEHLGAGAYTRPLLSSTQAPFVGYLGYLQ
jgi:hypothetical protein